MKFTYYLEKIHNVSMYPIISLSLFITFFVLVVFWAYKSDSKTIEHIENLPFEENDTPSGVNEMKINGQH